MPSIVSAAPTTGAAPTAAAAADATPATGAASGQGVKIGVAMKTELQPRWRFDVKFMEEKAKELGAELIVQWANDDAAKQASQVENLLSQDIDVLVLVSVDDKAAGPMAQSAKDQGVAVIAYDIAIKDADVDLFLSRDNFKVGEYQVQGALDFTKGKGNYVLVRGDPANNVAQDLNKKYDELLKPYVDKGDIKIVADQSHQFWSPEKALETAENALSANEDNIQAFVVSNDGMATGVSQAVKERDLAGKVYISGLDVDVSNARLIVEGTQTISVWTRIEKMGAQAAEAAVQLAAGQKPRADAAVNNGKMDVPTQYVEVLPVGKDNMCEFITKIAPPGWITADQVYQDVAKPADCG
jgi:D-xylose transport system substrate-binding protein